METILLWTALLLLLAIAASKASERLGVPALVFFIALGMAAGSDGPGGIHFDDPWLAQLLGTVALVMILFSGGLDTDWRTVRPVLWPALALSSLGVLLTAATLGVFATLLLDFSLLDGFLLGAIVSSTDAAAVFAVLRARSVSLKWPLRPLLELESGSNDPMAVFLTVAALQLRAQPEASPLALVPMFLQQMVLGGALGFLLARAGMQAINRIRLQYAGLYPVLSVALVLLTYGVTAVLGGNGFLAVYVAGIVMGNARFIHKTSLEHFHDGLAWVMQIAMFLTLGLLVFPSRLPAVAAPAFGVALCLALVARPVAVFATLAPARLGAREKLMVSWVGLRGAVPIILATFPLLAGIPGAETIFDVVFFTVLLSVLVQGTTIVPVAKLLGLQMPLRRRRAQPLALDTVEGADTELLELVIPPRAAVAGLPLVSVGLPPGCLIALIGRNDRFFVPGGDTRLAEGDVVLVLTNPSARRQAAEVLQRVLPDAEAPAPPPP